MEQAEQPEHGALETGPEFALKFRPNEPAVRPIWRFLVAIIFVQAADWVSANFAFRAFDAHPILQDVLYRFIGTATLLVGFHFMVRALDEKEGAEVMPSMGFRASGALREFATGVGIGIGIISFAVLIIAIKAGYTYQTFGDSTTPRHAIEISLLLIFGATYEELSFRGYAFQRLTMAVGPIAAIALFSIGFGAVHLGNPHSGGIWSWAFLNTIGVGALFAVAYLRTTALWMPIGMHFGWNFALGTLFGLPVSGLDFFAVMIHGKAYGPKWLTGGSYGLEASATGAIVILLGFVPVILSTRRRADGI
jgi:uncharacterized protein